MSLDAPDFVGSWLYDPSLYQERDRELYLKVILNFLGRFDMHILKRELCGNGERLEGKITDDIGEATFEGEIDESRIRFTKRYDEEAIANGGARIINYEGRRIKDGVYTGKFTVVTGNPPGWQGDFIMVAPINPLTN